MLSNRCSRHIISTYKKKLATMYIQQGLQQVEAPCIEKSIRRAILRNLRLFPFFGLNVQPWPPASARQPSDLKMKSLPSIFPMPGHAQNSPMELFLSLPCCFTTCSQIFSDAYYVFTLTRHQKLKEKIQELYCTLTNQCQMKQA